MPQAAPNDEPPPVLEARGICKSFPGVRALDGARLLVRRGRLNAVLGENGAGKSTLMNILAGVFQADSGEVLLDGQPVRFRNPREAHAAGVSIIHQELTLVPSLSIAENLFLGREPLNRFGLVDYSKMRRNAVALLARLGLRVDPSTRVEQLSIASQQVIEIARSLTCDSRVLILDEPTSALTGQESAALFRLIRCLKDDGVGLVYITHRLEELAKIADDITVLRDGRFIASKPFAGTTHDELVRLMVGRDALPSIKSPAPMGSSPLLTVKRLAMSGTGRSLLPRLDDISFSVVRGEVVGLFGLMGAGRTELLQCMFGLYPRRASGVVCVDGKQIDLRSPRSAIRAGMALAPEDRKSEGLVLGMSVTDNICLALRDRGYGVGLLSPAREQRVAREFTDRMAVKTPSLRQKVRNLSGGNQQKVVLAKWLAARPKVLLLDEPTRGIDIGAKGEIYRLIGDLAAQGLAVVLVSSELPEVLALADRVLILCEGRISGEFLREEATEDALLQAALPKSTPRQPA
ncbi:Ribose import ATP-binding protein RbsA [Pirellulimonas nuda]|uniref:Ribose import ATP-binding protein RbsA n=1 Tax=Pirellulimonas nuda TaxID=2528009 RepID=A0A518DG33_9BACT|nr:sugar ABC transporter ATP-binding protein [Pirellulimonas nuda]QDU90419.1 Ribose import ATP-binding protein RbsA [Pirellulimonas nuda]